MPMNLSSVRKARRRRREESKDLAKGKGQYSDGPPPGACPAFAPGPCLWQAAADCLPLVEADLWPDRLPWLGPHTRRRVVARKDQPGRPEERGNGGVGEDRRAAARRACDAGRNKRSRVRPRCLYVSRTGQGAGGRRPRRRPQILRQTAKKLLAARRTKREADRKMEPSHGA